MTEVENPLIQYFYFLIGPLAYVFYVIFVYIYHFSIVGVYNFVIGNLLTFIGFYYYYKALKTDPGTITEQNC